MIKKFRSIILFFLIFSCESDTSFKSLYNKSERDYYLADEIAGHIHLPFAKREYEWTEHPRGKIVVTTNNFGFRENENTNETKENKKIRILVTGDSHTDGVVYNGETFANQLEVLLNTGEQKSEVLNGGIGYYGPQNYAGFLKKFLFLKPDIYIVCVYSGNDFLDGIKMESENNRLKVPTRSFYYILNLWLFNRVFPEMSGQAMNQIKFFKQFPNMKKNTMEIFRKSLLEIKKTCNENKIELIVLLLPAKPDIEMESDSARINKAATMLQLSEEDLKINLNLSDELSRWLVSEEINFINLLGEMEKHNEELFWKKDWHLNHRGHRAVAEIVYQSKFNKYSN